MVTAVEQPPRWSEVLGEMSPEELQAFRDEAAAAEQRATGPGERIAHRKRRHAADVELRLRAAGTLPLPDLFRAAAVALLMAAALLAFVGYLASTVDGPSALLGLLGLPFGAAVARVAGRAGARNTWLLAVAVTATGIVALLAHASRQIALLIVVSTAAGLWYDALLVPFVVGFLVFARRRRRR
jgi:hypothetical protein